MKSKVAIATSHAQQRLGMNVRPRGKISRMKLLRHRLTRHPCTAAGRWISDQRACCKLGGKKPTKVADADVLQYVNVLEALTLPVDLAFFKDDLLFSAGL